MSRMRRLVRLLHPRTHGIGPGAPWASVALAAVLVLLATAQGVRSTNSVDLVLVLALDVSGSVNDREYDLQRIGLARAFRHPSVIDAITHGRAKRIAVMAVQWAGFREQFIAVPWSVISGATSAAAFADRLATMRRRYAYPLGITHISGVVRFATAQALAAPFVAGRRVVDISGDGKNNVNDSPQSARDDAVSAGMTINGLAITNEAHDLTEYYRAGVIGGPGAFVMTATDYDDYARAIRRKLLKEISQQFIM